LRHSNQSQKKNTTRIRNGNKIHVKIVINHSIVLRDHDSIVPTIIKNAIIIIGIEKASPCHDLRPYLSIFCLYVFALFSSFKLQFQENEIRIVFITTWQEVKLSFHGTKQAGSYLTENIGT
jgi:hypothetical protein